MPTLEMRKRDLVMFLWYIMKLTWKHRRTASFEFHSGLAKWAQNGWIACKHNGTRTITIRINGGAHDTGLHRVT